MMNILLGGLGFLGIIVVASVLGVNEYKVNQRREKRRKEHELKMKIKLQNKRDQFEAFQRLIETYERDCKECYEYDREQFGKCYPDYDESRPKAVEYYIKGQFACPKRNGNLSSLSARKDREVDTYFETEKPIRNLRVQLSDFTVGEIANLYSLVQTV